mmetsp:Transcript_60602/g.130037  ORF Transcript_60602/g.130037 Transcript_60602/m.130037 type:complete len:128 (-) Transcript_60602:410-793(-)
MQKLAPHQLATLRKKQAAAAKAHLGLPAHEIVRLNEEERKKQGAKAMMAVGSILLGGATGGMAGVAEAAVGQAAGAVYPLLGVATAGHFAEGGILSSAGVEAMGQEAATTVAQEAVLGSKGKRRINH